MIEFCCEFCSKNFKFEKNYLKHYCKEMERYELLHTIRGRAAFLLYNEWEKIRNHPKHSVNTFMKSRYFNSFIKFVEFSNRKLIPNKTEYIQYMIELEMPPMFWYDEDVYEKFIQYFDDNFSINRKLEITNNTLSELSNSLGCEISDLFNNLKPVDVLRLIIHRRLSPWFLLLNKEFMDFLIHKTNLEERILFNKVINPKKWELEFQNHQDEIDKIKKIIDF